MQNFAENFAEFPPQKLDKSVDLGNGLSKFADIFRNFSRICVRMSANIFRKWVAEKQGKVNN